MHSSLSHVQSVMSLVTSLALIQQLQSCLCLNPLVVKGWWVCLPAGSPPPAAAWRPLRQSAACLQAEVAASAWCVWEVGAQTLPPPSLPCSPDPQTRQIELRETRQCCPESDSHSTGGSEDTQGHVDTGPEEEEKNESHTLTLTCKHGCWARKDRRTCSLLRRRTEARSGSKSGLSRLWKGSLVMSFPSKQ